MPNRRVFYWFVEAAAPVDPATADLVLWTNGGPGCSGLFGLLEEMGPFRPTKDGGSLAANPYAWNRLSNIVYVEVPVGVGFSYSGDPEDYRTGDQVNESMNLGATIRRLYQLHTATDIKRRTNKFIAPSRHPQVTAQDNLRTVQAFFERFPHLRANDFYLASESYGGCVCMDASIG